MVILDTNVISEALKQIPEARVIAWLDAREPASVFSTSVTLAEMLAGIAKLPAGKRKDRLAELMERVFGEKIAGRILSFEEKAAAEYARIVSERTSSGRPISPMDAMIAAIARAQGATLATRNLQDFEGCGVKLVDPWGAK